jgi:pyruvate dehydrogenase E2 component (dihydrolipoamide acetyltransferase)
MAEFVMPTLGADMSAGTLVAWKKKPGDSVKRGEIIAEVDTEKAAIDVEVFTNGVIEKILVQPGEKVPVGTVLAIIREEGKPAAAMSKVQAEAEVQARPASRTTPPGLPAAAAAVETGRLRISPLARHKAKELGIDPATIQGTGPEGAITQEDVLRTAPSPEPAGPVVEAAERQARMRQAIAAAMARSKREIPHYYLSTTIDMSRAMNWLAEANLKRAIPDRLLYGALLIKAVALALRGVPELNAVWKDGKPAQSQAVHVGVAISLRQGGLIAPALHDADRQSLDDLMRNFRDLVTRARAGSLRSSELSDPTITLTSLGEQGVESVLGVIYPPQVALVGFGKVVERPWIAEGQIVARQVVTATLSADHRVSDGHRGGRFLATIDRLLQEPGRL